MTTSEHTFHSWEDFKSGLALIFGGAQPIMKNFLFRGQADADWKLMSSFDRAFVGDDNKRNKIYLKYLDFFRLINQRLGKYVTEDSDEAGAIAQHYGMPTRLIDWTLSPYAASFFAFYYAKVDRIESTHVAVWAINKPKFSLATDHRHFQIVKSKSIENVRIHSQIGSFIAARGDLFDLELYLDEKSVQEVILHKCLIPSDFIDEALNDLILMGQSPADIYPDFEGVAKYVRLRMAFEGFNL